MQNTATSLVVKRVTWPHEVIYSATEKPASYKELSITLFVQGNLVVMRGEEEPVKKQMASHLEELISDAKLYRWEKVRAYHGAWFNHLEQG